MISANGGLPAHRYTPQVTQRWPRGSEPASAYLVLRSLVVVVEAVAPVWLWRWVTRLRVRPVLVGRWDSLMWESWSVHLFHGCRASPVPQGDALGGAAGSVMVLESSGLGCCSYPSKAPSGTRGLGNHAAVKRF